MLSLVFEFGTLALRGLAEGEVQLPPSCQWDARSGCHRAPAIAYADLVRQWYDQLRQAFGVMVGVVGGGDHEVRPLTVTTYDSAHMHMEHLGSRFGMLVFDECHHLLGTSYALSARLSIAPFRLGLTATPERADGREKELK